MKYPWLKKVIAEDFRKPWDQLPELIGLENAIKIMQLFEGQDPHFPKLNLIFKKRYVESIRADFRADSNAARIAAKYSLTEKHIRHLVNAPVGQASLFDSE